MPGINSNENITKYIKKKKKENRKGTSNRNENQENIVFSLDKLPTFPQLKGEDETKSKIVKLPEKLNFIYPNDDVIYDDNLSLSIRNSNYQSQSHQKSTTKLSNKNKIIN